MRRKKTLAWSAAVAVFLGLTLGWLIRPWRDAPGDVVPGSLQRPWMWQADVATDPPGPASVLVGGDTLGFRGTDIFDSEGKIAVVGRGGDYRMLRYGGWDSVAAGEHVLLSPDGRRVASEYREDSPAADGLEILDLTSGASTEYRGGLTEGRCCGPVAWAPDGGSLLVEAYQRETDNTRLALLDLRTDRLTELGAPSPSQTARTASRGAFAPDGGRLAIAEGTQLRLFDRTGGQIWTVELGERRYLAGPGAFSLDGARIAIAELAGCLADCDRDALAARRWTIGYLDAGTGRPVDGPALPPVTGSAVRALGWSQGRDLVVLRYQPEDDAYRPGRGDESGTYWNDTGWYETGHLTLLALEPGGRTRTLLDPPDGVLTMDVSRDLLEAGRFGGPEPVAAPFPARGIIWWAVGATGCLLIFVAPLLILITRVIRSAIRRRRVFA